MKTITYVCFVLLTAAMIFSSKSHSLENKTTLELAVGYSEFPPYTYTRDEGQASGEVIDILRKVVVKAGYDFVAIPGPNRRLFRNILTDSIDILMVVPFKDADSNRLIFGEVTIDILDTTVFWVSEKAVPIHDITQLQTQNIITIAGYSFGGLFKGEGLLVNTDRFLSETHSNALKALTLARAPYLLAYKKPVMFYYEPESMVKLSSYTFDSIPLVLSIRRSYPDAEKVLKELEKHYMKLFPERFLALNPRLSVD